MNERLKELLEQATEVYDYWYRGESACMVDQKMFAELIIQECISILSRNNPCPPGSTIMYSLIQDEYFDKGWQVAVETKSNQIKKHFGVEE